MTSHVISFSGGKDSTAMLLEMVRRGEDIHSVVWFDTERDFPEILGHIQQIKNAFDVPFVRIRHWIGFDFLEERYGAAHGAGGWCVNAKKTCCDKYMRLVRRRTPDAVECIGFASDEQERADKISKKWPVRFPLIEYGINQKDALEICYKNKYRIGNIYDWMPSKRVSCYDCIKQGKKDCEAVVKHHPELAARKTQVFNPSCVDYFPVEK